MPEALDIPQETLFIVGWFVLTLILAFIPEE